MVSQQMLISVALPVAAMAIVVGSVANVQDSTLAPGLDTIDAATDFGYPEVTIDEENELRGVTVFNMLSAQNCLYPTLAFKRDGELTQEDEDFIEELEGDYQPLEKVDAERTEDTFNGGEGLKTPYELGYGEFTYYNHGDVLRDAMELEGFNGACLGGKQLSLTAPLKEHYEYLAKAASAADTALYLMQPWTWQIGEGADNEELNRGALQGRYGRIEFEMDDTVLIDDPRLMSMRFSEDAINSGAGADNAPDFIRGRRAAAFFPEGYLRGDAAGAWDKDPGALDKSYWGVKMLGGGAAAYAGGAAGAAIGSTIGVYAIAGTSIGGPVGTVVGTVVGAVAAGYAYLKTTDHVENMLSIGPHPGVLIGVDQPIGLINANVWEEEKSLDGDEIFSGKGMFKYHERDNVDWREDLNAFRVRMVNVPIVMDPTFFPDEARTRNKASLQMGYNYITTRANYVLCNQSEGFIQSNAGEEIDYDGKKKYQNDPPIFRDVVYPRIELSRRDATCLSDAHFGRSSEYNVVKEVKTHQEFLDDNGDFKGPISSSLGVFPGIPIREMKDDDAITNKTIEDVLVLSPEKRANLTQGIRKTSISDDMEWWDRPTGGVYQPVFGVSDDQCEEYDDTYDVTKMFTDNRNQIYEEMSDYLEEEYSDEKSWVIGEENGNQYIKIFSDRGSPKVMPEYSFGRFSNDSEITVDFEIDVEIEEGESYSDLARFIAEPATFYLEKGNAGNIEEGNPRVYVRFSHEEIKVGTETLSRTSFNGEEFVTYNDPDPLDTLEYDKDNKYPIEGEFRLIVDKDDEKLKLKESTEDGYNELMSKSLTDIEGISIWSMDLMKVKSHIPESTQTGAKSHKKIDFPRADLLLNDVKVDGTVAGCTG